MWIEELGADIPTEEELAAQIMEAMGGEGRYREEMERINRIAEEGAAQLEEGLRAWEQAQEGNA